MIKPRIFIASSVESLDVADAINVNFDHEAEVTVWKNGFSLSTSTIDSLIKKAATVDFAIFIFTPDDLVIIRDQSKYLVRDNVLFELGLLIGTLGKQRCFIVKPRDIQLHFPTDLLGLTPADYESNRSDGDLASAVNYPCVLIKKEIAHQGLISQDQDIQKRKRKKLDYNYKIGDTELQLLAEILKNSAGSPNGASVWNTFRSLKTIPDENLGLAAIKLERLGYLEKGIDSDINHEFYTFSITADGIDYMLNNEHLLFRTQLMNKTQSWDDIEDDIPF